MNLKFSPTLALMPLLAATLAACQQEQPAQVYLPPSGDAERGKQAFVEYKCYNCHSIPGVELPQREAEPPMVLALGVRMHRVRSYGDLLSAVLFPDHTVSPKFQGALKAAGEDPESAEMPDFTERMTVAELIDLAEFLDDQYSDSLGTQYRGKDPRPTGRLRTTNGD